MKKTYLLLIVVFISCCKDMEQTDNCEDIKVDLKTSLPSVNAEDYFDVEPVFLSKTDACLIGIVTKVVAYEDYLFVLDDDVAESLFLFDRKGQFIRKFGQKGKGKGEYREASDFMVKDNQVYLYDGPKQKMLIFDLDGKFIKDIRLSKHGGYAFYMFDYGSFFTISPESIFCLNFYNKKGILKDRICNSQYDYVHWQTFKSISTYNDSVFVMTAFNNTIYEVKDHNIFPRYALDYGKYNYRLQEGKELSDLMDMFHSGNYATSDGFSNNKDNIFMSINADKVYKGIYFKSDKRLLLTNYLMYQYIPFQFLVGDYDNNGAIFTCSSDIAYSVITQILESDLDLEINISDPIKNIDPNNNPIVFILTPKEGSDENSK